MENAKNKVEENSIQVKAMADAIIGDSTVEIDAFMNTVRELFLNTTQILNDDLDKIILQIPVHVYYLTTLLQDIDLKKGISSEQAKYRQNDILIRVTGTVAEKQAKAENESASDRVIQLAYKNAANILQSKVNGAMEILSSAKKVQQRRLEEMRLTKLAGNSVGGF